MTAHGEPSFFELGVEDADRARAFFEALFGWRFEPGPRGFGIGTPTIPGGVHGDDPGAAPHLFFAVDDLERAVELVRELGGTIEGPNVDADEESIRRFGRFRLCRDDQGSPFGLHQPPARA